MVGVGIVQDWVEVPQFVCSPSWLVGFPFGVTPNWVVVCQVEVGPN